MSASGQASGDGGPGKAARLTIEDTRHMLGDIGSGKIAAILKLEPSQEELEEAIAWNQGETRTMSEAHHHLTGRVAKIYEILAADEAWAEEEDRPGHGE